MEEYYKELGIAEEEDESKPTKGKKGEDGLYKKKPKATSAKVAEVKEQDVETAEQRGRKKLLDKIIDNART